MEPDQINVYEELTARVSPKELSTLLKVSSSLASTMELDCVLQIAIESAADLMNLQTGAIYTLELGNLLLGATTPPLPTQFPDELRRAFLGDHPHILEAVNTKAPVYLEDARTVEITPAEKTVIETRHLISILYFPLLLKEDVIGVFIVGSTDKVRKFSSNEIDLCYILSFQVSLAVANAQLFQRAQQALVDLSHAYDATLMGWSQVLDMRDHVTDEHTHRVADLTMKLAVQMGVPEVDLGHVRRGALLHDIGKMAIPDSILQKPGLLTDEEMNIMRTHPVMAYTILSQIDYLAPAMDIPYCHHEKWDGTGYPRGLKGEHIPLVAQIFSIIDVYDALTSDRPYRKAWTEQAAIDYIKEQNGKQFNPQVVEAFLELLNNSD
jgi:putative nucleotidyltransferase with HDIG domain